MVRILANFIPCQQSRALTGADVDELCFCWADAKPIAFSSHTFLHHDMPLRN